MWIIIYAVLIFLVISFGAGLSLIPASERKRMTLGQYIERVIVPGQLYVLQTILYLGILLIPAWVMVKAKEMAEDDGWLFGLEPMGFYEGDSSFVQILNEVVEMQNRIDVWGVTIASGIVVMTIILGVLIFYRTHREQNRSIRNNEETATKRSASTAFVEECPKEDGTYSGNSDRGQTR